MDSEGFMMDIGTAELLFRTCSRYKISEHKDRVALLRKLVKRKKAKYMRDVTPFLSGKKVLQFKAPHNPGPEHWCDDCKSKENL